MDEGDSILTDISENLPGARDAAAISYRYRIMAMICLCQDNFLIRHRLSTLEALLVLIWTISHNEGAERSWVLLGKIYDSSFGNMGLLMIKVWLSTLQLC